MPVRLAAGYVLLAGTVSLMVSHERLPPWNAAWQGRLSSAAADAQAVGDPRPKRTLAMEPQDRATTTVFNPPDFQAGSGLAGSGGPSDAAPGRIPSQGEVGIPSVIRQGIERLEGVIQQYPWPTVVLGVGLGFLLARRVR